MKRRFAIMGIDEEKDPFIVKVEANDHHSAMSLCLIRMGIRDDESLEENTFCWLADFDCNQLYNIRHNGYDTNGEPVWAFEEISKEVDE